MTTSIPASSDTDLIARLAKEIFADSPAAGTSPAPAGSGISDYPTDAKEIAPPVHPDAPVSSSQTIQPVESASGGHASSSEEAYPFGEPRCYKDEGKSSSNPAPPEAVLPYTSESLSGADFYFLRGRKVSGVSSLPNPSSQTGHGLVLPTFNVEAVRRDFPALHQKVNGKPLIWLDNAATTHKPQSVIDATSYFYSHDNSNIHRAAYELAERATRAFEGAREKVREFIGAADKKEIVFLRGTTEAINLVAQSYGRQNIGAGDEILITNIEHHANIVPWQLLAEQTGAAIRVAPVNDRGELILDQFASLLSGRTKLVSVTHVANSIGTVNPVEQIIAISHAYGVPVLVDAAQSTPHMPVNVTALDVDFLVFSGHKVFGPTGIGALYGKSALLEAMPPWQGGGHMIRNVTFAKTTYQNAPEKFEAGTPDIAGAIGLGAAIDYLQNIGLAPIAAYEHELLTYATEALQSVRGLRLIGTAANKASVLSFVIAGYEPEKIAEHLDQQGIAARAGHHCAQPALRRFGVEKTVRASLAFYNTREEVDVLVRALHHSKAPDTGFVAPAMKTIKPAYLQQLLDSHAGLALIDVRTPVEYAEVHVPQAHNVPLDQFDPKSLFTSGQLPKDQPVYLLCRSGGRASKAAEKFAKEGLDNAVVVEGGTLAWIDAGLPVNRGTAKVISLERQVRIAAGTLVLTGVLLAIFVHPYFIGLSAFVGAGLVFAGITDWCGMGLLLAKLPWNSRL